MHKFKPQAEIEVQSKFLWHRLSQRRIWDRIWRERLTEPLHLNFASLVVAVFGSFRTKVDFDIVLRQHQAYSLLRAADMAQEIGLDQVTAIEFGVAQGAGLMNMCDIASRVTAETGVKFAVVGFDRGSGMPSARDWRDHPDIYQSGDFPMGSVETLSSCLPKNAQIRLGELAETVPEFLAETDLEKAPIAFISIDVDYYSSTVDALRIFESTPAAYLPSTLLYLDDISFLEHSRWAGEQLAVEEFNSAHSMRKIGQYRYLRNTRIFRNAGWIDHIYVCHVFDHPRRQGAGIERQLQILDNPYLKAPRIA